MAGRLVLAQEEGEEGLSCDVEVGEEGRLWMEEVEALKRKNKNIIKELSCLHHPAS